MEMLARRRESAGRGTLLREPLAELLGESLAGKEVQIRTAFEHALIVGTHPLTYKTPPSIGDARDWQPR